CTRQGKRRRRSSALPAERSEARAGRRVQNPRGARLVAEDSPRADARRPARVLARPHTVRTMSRRLSTSGAAVGFAVLLAVFATWPTVLSLRTAIFSHHDSYFSVWRLAWIAHALTTAPWRLFDANIFYPTTGTLAYSDATLLEGILGTPLFLA